MKWLYLGYGLGSGYKITAPKFDVEPFGGFCGIHIRDHYKDGFFSVNSWSYEMDEIIYKEENTFKSMDEAKQYCLKCIAEYCKRFLGIVGKPAEELNKHDFKNACEFRLGGSFGNSAGTIDEAIEKLKKAKKVLGGDAIIELWDGDEPRVYAVTVRCEPKDL